MTVMVNSTWTEKHILDLWNIPFSTHRVYPPCEVSHLKNLEHMESDKIIIVSVGQFRPEKDHPLQLQAMYELRTLLEKDEALWEKVIQVNFRFENRFFFLINDLILLVEIGDNWVMPWQRR